MIPTITEQNRTLLMVVISLLGITIALLLILLWSQHSIVKERAEYNLYTDSHSPPCEEAIALKTLGILEGIPARPALNNLCELYNVDCDIIDKVIECESNWKQSARGAAGEIGVAQFLPSTFYRYAEKYNMHEANIYNEHDQLHIMVLMFRDGQQKQWTCWRNLYKQLKK